MKIFLATTHTARSGARTGIQTVVRGLLAGGDFAPVAWFERGGYFHPLKPEWMQNLDQRGGEGWLPAASLLDPRHWPAWAASGGRAHRTSLARHPAHAATLRGAWLLMPELMDGPPLRRMIAWAARHGMKTAVIFHDAIPWLRPDLGERDAPRHADYMRALAVADIVLPVSEFSAGGLRDFWASEKITPTRLVVCPLPGESLGEPRVTTPKTDFSTPAKILCVSTLEPRKNHRALLAALAQIRAPIQLHLAGGRYDGTPEIADEVTALAALDPRLIWHGSLHQDALRALYRECDLTVYPSFLEGFGLPVMESLWHARGCLCADFGVMAENAVGGGCATVDVLDPAALAASLEALATSPERLRALSLEATQRPLKTWCDYAQTVTRSIASLP